jgi:hypothetical protein
MREHIADWGQHEVQSWSKLSIIERDRRGAFGDAPDIHPQILGGADEQDWFTQRGRRNKMRRDIGKIPRVVFECSQQFGGNKEVNGWGLRNTEGKWSREWELNPRPADYESAALPLSYLGPFYRQ